MTHRIREVAVTRLPAVLSVNQRQELWKELHVRLNVERPCIVLECSQVEQFDLAMIHWVLCCLEEAMKRNGDIKLAAITPKARAALEATGANRLFEIFETEAKAVDSFGQTRAAAEALEIPLLASQIRPELKSHPPGIFPDDLRREAAPEAATSYKNHYA